MSPIAAADQSGPSSTWSSPRSSGVLPVRSETPFSDTPFSDAPFGDTTEDELTIRRNFAPKAPPRVEVELSDADATWKWTRPAADAQGRFTGLALPILDDDVAVTFEPSEVESTQERQSPFALAAQARASAAAIPLARRRARKPRPLLIVESTAELLALAAPQRNYRFAVGLVLAMVLTAAASAWLVRTFSPRVTVTLMGAAIPAATSGAAIGAALPAATTAP
ncbi:MAG: hypothetical protein HYV09_21315 [Deltaproteobacteria bacterium]|nr:hypothetical protein [Deltaproteobacteria bacterium]